jgi:DNA-binding transcriptional regulator YiaG
MRIRMSDLDESAPVPYHAGIMETRPQVSGDEIRSLRKRLGLTQAGLARLLGIRASSVSDWEKGKLGVTGTAKLVLATLIWGGVADPTSEPELSAMVEGGRELCGLLRRATGDDAGPSDEHELSEPDAGSAWSAVGSSPSLIQRDENHLVTRAWVDELAATVPEGSVAAIFAAWPPTTARGRPWFRASTYDALATLAAHVLRDGDLLLVECGWGHGGIIEERLAAGGLQRLSPDVVFGEPTRRARILVTCKGWFGRRAGRLQHVEDWSGIAQAVVPADDTLLVLFGRSELAVAAMQSYRRPIVAALPSDDLERISAQLMAESRRWRREGAADLVAENLDLRNGADGTVSMRLRPGTELDLDPMTFGVPLLRQLFAAEHGPQSVPSPSALMELVDELLEDVRSGRPPLSDGT